MAADQPSPLCRKGKAARDYPLQPLPPERPAKITAEGERAGDEGGSAEKTFLPLPLFRPPPFLDCRL